MRGFTLSMRFETFRAGSHFDTSISTNINKHKKNMTNTSYHVLIFLTSWIEFGIKILRGLLNTPIRKKTETNKITCKESVRRQFQFIIYLKCDNRL